MPTLLQIAWVSRYFVIFIEEQPPAPNHKIRENLPQINFLLLWKTFL